MTIEEGKHRVQAQNKIAELNTRVISAQKWLQQRDGFVQEQAISYTDTCHIAFFANVVPRIRLLLNTSRSKILSVQLVEYVCMASNTSINTANECPRITWRQFLYQWLRNLFSDAATILQKFGSWILVNNVFNELMSEMGYTLQLLVPRRNFRSWIGDGETSNYPQAGLIFLLGLVMNLRKT